MGHRANGIFGSLPILAAAFGRREGINVVVGGSQACTDGKTIHLPALPIDCDEVLETKALAFLIHEAGHIELTDMSVLGEAETPLIRNLLNVVEDIRMESLRAATYPGYPQTRRKLIELLKAEGMLGTTEQVTQAHPQDVICRAALTYLYVRDLGQPCEEQADLWMERAEQLLGSVALVKFKALLGRVDALDTTTDALALARWIHTLVEDTAKEPPPPNDAGGNPASTDDRDQEDPAGGSSQASGDTGSDAGIDGGADSAGADDGRQGDATSGMTSGSSPSGDDAAQPPDREALAKALAAGAGEFQPTDLGDITGESLEKEAAASVASDQAAHPGTGSVDRPLAVTKSTVRGQGELDKVLAHSQQLRTRLAAAMDAEARVKVVHRQAGTRLDGRMAYRLFTGNTRVFVRKENKRKVNTAVQILLDRSGSMSGHAIEVACQAALATTVGIGQIHGCKVAAAAFPEVEVLKEFDEAARGTAGRFGLGATGGTPMGRAMIWAAAQLAARREDRKMLVVVTDGAPDDPGMVSRLVAKYRAADVEVIGVGIQTPAVKGLFPVSTVIQSVDELAAALFQIVHRQMRRVA